MGAWGVNSYADDTTCDVRDAYGEAVRSGLSSQAVSAKVLDAYRATLDSHEVACLVYFALADTAWRHGRLTDDVRSKALALLGAGGDLAAWAEGSVTDLAGRKRALLQLQMRLQSPQPAAKVVKVSAPVGPVVRSTAPVGSLFLLVLPSGDSAALVLVGYRDLGKSIDPVFSVLCWRGAQGELPCADAPVKTLELSTYDRSYAHVAVIPGDARPDIMASLQSTGVVVQELVYELQGRTIWWSAGRMAKEIDAQLLPPSRP